MNGYSIIVDGGDRDGAILGTYETLEQAIAACEAMIANGEDNDCGGLVIHDPEGNEAEW